MTEVARIGDALVERGAITKAQLEEALSLEPEGQPSPLGERLVRMFDIAPELVDEVNVSAVLLPRFRKLLLSRLLTISRADKFAKGLDVRQFVVSIATRPTMVEVRVVSRRQYDVQGGKFMRTITDRGFVTNMDVHVELTTSLGQTVSGRISVQHDGLENSMTIMDDEKHIRESVYYGLRTAYRAGK